MSDDRMFDALLEDVARSVDDDLEANAGVPDLLAVVELAHRLDATRVPQAAVEEVSTYAPIVSLGEARRQRQSRNDHAFDEIVREVRGHVDQDVARALGATTQKEEPAAPTPARRRRWGMVLVAAVALLGIGIGIGTLRGRVLTQDLEEDPSAALLSPQSDGDKKVTQGQASASERPPSSDRPEAPEPSPTSVVPEPETQQEPAATSEPVKAPKRSGKHRPRPASTETLAQKLDRLEREANEAWAAGQHAEAESIFRTIIKLDRRGSWAESAYGELFTLRRQRGKDVASQWRAYLERFPNGRFADDATAGLCRRAPDAQKVECWSAYLDAIPKGSFRQQAQREIEQYRAEDTP